MTRDMQIGLLLALGFLALVGGVLYYRIEHPDELEHFWNGSAEVAGAKPGAGQDADMPTAEKPADSQAPLPSVPAPSLPTLDSFPTTSSPTSPPVQLTEARATNPNLPASPLNSGSSPALNLDVNSASQQNKTQEAAPVSSPTPDLTKKEPPAPTLPNLDLTAPKASADKSNDANNKTAAHPSPPMIPDLSVKSETNQTPAAVNADNPVLPAPLSAGPPTLDLSIPVSPSPAQHSTKEKPKDDKSQDDKSMWLSDAEKAKTQSSSQPNGSPPSVGAPPLVMPNARSPLNEAPKSASSPVTTTPTPPTTGTTLPPNDLPKSVPDPASNSLWLDTQPTPLKTSPLPSPPDVTPPGNSTPNRDGGQYREYPAPRAGLGRPVPESVLAMNERRWSDSSNVSTPIIPSSAGNSSGNNFSNSTSPATGGRVTTDTTISSIRVVQGETFSSLSQRAYGSEIYAEALAAYNHEAGMIEADQPAGNQVVLLPAKFDLENRFGNLLRKQPFRSTTTKNTTPSNTTSTNTANRDARVTTDGPTYRVRKGEQLFDVAKLTLGDGFRWGEIYSLNKDLLHESTELHADMMLRLPTDAKVDNGKPR